MEIKKSKKADLEKTRGTSMLIGYIVALAVMFAAFEWTTRDYVETEPVVYAAYAQMEEEIVPITQPIFTAAPPPPADAPQVAEILDIVENDEEIVEEKIETSESTTEAISGPVAQVSGPVATGPVVVEEASDEGEIFQVVEQMPEFPGGMQALMAYLSKNIKYPSVAQDNGIQGRVLVSFVVNKDGSIVDPEVIKSVDAALDKEAMRVIKAMPKWNPGKQRGKPVRVKYTVPVLFRLQ
ncbi:MAG: energy transducer TonB [Bacteroidaceae bacterium]|jgi:protein TonB|nr:energy transducer TonB [Bacteroidaceae bacterium]MBQ2166833.1 energy transducer TonB [Bacteroidaceae bacterium]MBQ2182856.1 energy transducer TonB [Bacteroidaceae bacterium]MBQ2340441.1 energy transducer TonB [Bacteroidaceae bacterium]MBQ2585635.1 energy transducer TonB [Bacteroidaceae bacterium]